MKGFWWAQFCHSQGHFLFNLVNRATVRHWANVRRLGDSSSFSAHSWFSFNMAKIREENQCSHPWLPSNKLSHVKFRCKDPRSFLWQGKDLIAALGIQSCERGILIHISSWHSSTLWLHFLGRDCCSSSDQSVTDSLCNWKGSTSLRAMPLYRLLFMKCFVII